MTLDASLLESAITPRTRATTPTARPFSVAKCPVTSDSTSGSARRSPNPRRLSSTRSSKPPTRSLHAVVTSGTDTPTRWPRWRPGTLDSAASAGQHDAQCERVLHPGDGPRAEKPAGGLPGGEGRPGTPAVRAAASAPLWEGAWTVVTSLVAAQVLLLPVHIDLWGEEQGVVIGAVFAFWRRWLDGWS